MNGADAGGDDDGNEQQSGEYGECGQRVRTASGWSGGLHAVSSVTESQQQKQIPRCARDDKTKSKTNEKNNYCAAWTCCARSSRPSKATGAGTWRRSSACMTRPC